MKAKDDDLDVPFVKSWAVINEQLGGGKRELVQKMKERLYKEDIYANFELKLLCFDRQIKVFYDA